MKKSLLILTALFALGCEQAHAESYRSAEEIRITKHLEPICLRGVVYYFYKDYKKSAMSPAYNQDGTLILCINEEEMKQDGAE